ncbi:GPW/gp25 family protein [Nocardioides salsibiostraticola]
MTATTPDSQPPSYPLRIGFPYAVDGRGRTASCTEGEHVRQLIEQVLLTSPGERVMRPGFGGSLMQRVFEPGGPELLSTTQYVVQATLSQELGDRITIDELVLDSRDNALVVTVTWTLLRTGQQASSAIVIPGTTS